jgi:DnaJ-class molecular chaperone
MIRSFSYVKRVKNEGLPHHENRKQKGDLLIHFAVKFPEFIPKSIRVHVEKVFDEIEKCQQLK